MSLLFSQISALACKIKFVVIFVSAIFFIDQKLFATPVDTLYSYSPDQKQLIKNIFKNDHNDEMAAGKLQKIQIEKYLKNPFDQVERNVYQNLYHKINNQPYSTFFGFSGNYNTAVITGTNAAKGKLHYLKGFDLLNKGEIVSINNHFEKALYHYGKQPVNIEIIAGLFYNLGILNFVMGDFTKAEKFYKEAFKRYQTLKQPKVMIDILIKLSDNELALEQYLSAENSILKKALLLSYQIHYTKGELKCYEQLGKIYHQRKMYTQAKWFFIQANTLAYALNFKEEVISTRIQLAKVKNDIGDYYLALDDLNVAKKALNATNKSPLYHLDIYKTLIKTYNGLGNKPKANNADASYKRLVNSLLI